MLSLLCPTGVYWCFGNNKLKPFTALSRNIKSTGFHPLFIALSNFPLLRDFPHKVSARKRSKAKDCISFLPRTWKLRENSSKSHFHDWETNEKERETSSLAWIFFASRNYLVHSKSVIQISRARLCTVVHLEVLEPIAPHLDIGWSLLKKKT